MALTSKHNRCYKVACYRYIHQQWIIHIDTNKLQINKFLQLGFQRQGSFHVFVQEFPVEIIPDGIINESLRCLGFTTGLVLKHNIIIPPKPNRCIQKPQKNEIMTKTNRVNSKSSHFGLEGKYWDSNLLFTLKDAGLFSNGFPRRSSASFTLSSSSCSSRSCTKQFTFHFLLEILYVLSTMCCNY